MVFMAAETIEGSAPLHEAADSDLAEMFSVGSGDSLNLLVQIHGYGQPRRYHVGVREEPVPADQLDFTEGQALGHFIEYAMAAAEHRPDDYSMLVLWGHAYDFAFGRSHKPDGTVDALELATLSKLLKRLQDNYLAGFAAQFPNRPLPENPKLDILGFDACDLSTVEMACQLQPFASYVLGSEIGIPIPGWPYDRVLKRFRNPEGRVMGPAEGGSWVVRRYCEAYTSEQRTVSLTLLDLDRIPELFAYGDVLAFTLLAAIERDADTRDLVASLFRDSRTADDRPFVDVADLCLNLIRNLRDPLVAAAAKALGDFLISPLPRVVKGSAEGLGKPFIVAYGRNAGDTARLNGISAYAPHVVPDIDARAVRHAYEDFEFAQQTKWSELVHTLAGLS
jgi:Clostripain family